QDVVLASGWKDIQTAYTPWLPIRPRSRRARRAPTAPFVSGTSRRPAACSKRAT
ncbi:hypothetical protein GGH97_002511, partial [Coemansia sp. RSA 475]